MKTSIMQDEEKNGKKNRDQRRAEGHPAAWLILTAVWILIWQIGTFLVDNPLLLPGPVDTLQALVSMAGEHVFYLNALWTIGRCLLAMVLSFCAGAAGAWGAYQWRPVRRLLALPVAFFKAVPVMAVVIYIILLADSDWVAVIVCFFMCFPVVYTNLLEGLDAAGTEFLELAEVCGLNRKEEIRHIFLPALLPQIKASAELLSGLSWKAVVAAEVLSIPAYSLGYPMLNAKYYLETADLFAYILVIVGLSLLFARAVRHAMAGMEWKPYRESRLRDRAKSESLQKTKESGEPPEILISHLGKAFGEKKVLEDFSMTFPSGEVTALMGPSGQGKTTLMRMIAGLDSPDRGEIRLEPPAADRWRREEGADRPSPENTAFLFQEDRLLPWMNLFDNMALPLLHRGTGQAERKDTVEAMAESLELTDALYKLPSQMSGGMRSRAALGRTFLMEGKVMILDEPLRGLDEELKKRVVAALWDRYTKRHTTIVVTHNREDAELLADRTITFSSGEEASCGQNQREAQDEAENERIQR